MGKTLHRKMIDYTPSKKEIIQNGDRVEQKHRKRFIDFCNETQDDTQYEPNSMFPADIVIEDDTLIMWQNKRY